MRRRLQIGALAYLALRWVLSANPGYVMDVASYKGWALRAAQNGLSQVYATSHMDYPPLYAWILYPLGKLYFWFSAGDPTGAAAGAANSVFLTFLMKLPPLLFDLGIALLIARYALRLDDPRLAVSEPADEGGPRVPAQVWAWVLPTAYLLNPAILFNTAYWGEPDSVHSFFILAAFLSIALGRRAWPAWVLWTLATCMKPLGAPFLPLLGVLSLALFGMKRTLVGVAAAAATVLVVFSPFLLTGQGATVFQRVVGDTQLMAFTSSNAHNLWWLLGSWRNSEVPWLGPITATQFGLGLFGIVYALLLWKAHRLHRAQKGGIRPMQIFALAAAVGFSFFMLSTHMHENHMFIVIPLLLPLLPASRRLRWMFALVTVGVLLNLAMHDLAIPARRPFTFGGATGVLNVHLQRPFALGELVTIWLSTVLNLAVYGWFTFNLLRPKGLLEELGPVAEPGARETAARPAPVGVRG